MKVGQTQIKKLPTPHFFSFLLYIILKTISPYYYFENYITLQPAKIFIHPPNLFIWNFLQNKINNYVENEGFLSIGGICRPYVDQNPIKSNKYCVVLLEPFKKLCFAKKDNYWQVYENWYFPPNLNGLQHFNNNFNEYRSFKRGCFGLKEQSQCPWISFTGPIELKSSSPLGKLQVFKMSTKAASY